MTLSQESREDLPAKTEEVLAQGARLWAATNNTAPELQDIIWLLVEEASQTMRALPGDGPSNKTGYWPDLVWQLNEIEQAYNEIETEGRESENERRLKNAIYISDRDRPPAPSAAALERFLTVMDWLRSVRCRNHKALRMQLILALAGGLSPTRAAKLERFASLQFGTRQAVVMFRKRALNNMEDAIKKQNPSIIVGSHAQTVDICVEYALRSR